MYITAIKTDLEPLEPGIKLSLGLCLSKSHMIPALLNTVCLDHADKSPALKKKEKEKKKTFPPFASRYPHRALLTVHVLSICALPGFPCGHLTQPEV